MKHKTLFIAAIALTLIGCGGGSAGRVTSPPPPPPPVAADAPQYNRALNEDANAPLAAINAATGKLHYGFYANRGQSNAVHIVPDFSYAGYMGGGIALPDYASIPVRETLSPAPGDDLARIQAALDAVAALPADSRGIRGAVLLTAGTYEADGQISIPASGVILRGEGQGPAGTILRSTSTAPDTRFIIAQGEGNGDNPRTAAVPARTQITQSYVPVGSNSVGVASTAGYAAGDVIAVQRTPNDTWLGPNGVDTAQYGWTADGYEVSFQRTVTGINENVLTFDIPITDTIESQYGGGEVYRADTSARLSQIGIENLRLETLDYADNTRTDRAFYAISYGEVQNSWIRDVTVRYFSRAFNLLNGTHFVTAHNLAHIDPDFAVVGGNHYAFDFGGGGMNLFQRCYSDQSRHAFTSGSKAAGPNVFLDCLAENGTNDSGPHQRWAVGTLFDNTSDDLIRVQSRQSSGSGHGWAGAQQMLWNGLYDRIVLQAPPGAMNYAVGNIGTMINGSFDPSQPEGIIENEGSAALPRSLYLQQLEDRLGPAALDNIIYPEQKSGTIYTKLQAWKGDGTLEPD